MFTIQYEAIDGEVKMQSVDGRTRSSLVQHLARFERPIVAVFEQANPITKAVRRDLREWPGSKTRYAMDFATSPR
jgi:hypothetical protein